MTNEAVNVLVGVYPAETDADTHLKALEAIYKDRADRKQISAALALRRSADGKFRYREVGLTAGKGAAGGVAAGVLLGIITGGGGLVLGAIGAAIGGLMGKRRQDQGISSQIFNQIAAALTPGTSAVLIVVEPEALPALEQQVVATGADVFTLDVSTDIAAQLEQQHASTTSTLQQGLAEDETTAE